VQRRRFYVEWFNIYHVQNFAQFFWKHPVLVIPPTEQEVNALPAFVCLFVCLSVSQVKFLIKNACMDLDEMLRVDRC